MEKKSTKLNSQGQETEDGEHTVIFVTPPCPPALQVTEFNPLGEMLELDEASCRAMLNYLSPISLTTQLLAYIITNP